MPCDCVINTVSGARGASQTPPETPKKAPSTGLLPLDLRSSLEVPVEAHLRGVRDDGRGGVYVYGDKGYTHVKRKALAKLLPQPDPAEYERFRQQQHVHFVTAQ